MLKCVKNSSATAVYSYYDNILTYFCQMKGGFANRTVISSCFCDIVAKEQRFWPDRVFSAF